LRLPTAPGPVEKPRLQRLAKRPSSVSIPIHECYPTVDVSLRGRPVDPPATINIVVPRASVDKFFLTAEQSIKASFELRPPDDRNLRTLASDLAARTKRTTAAFSDVTDQSGGLVANMEAVYRTVSETRTAAGQWETRAKVLATRIDRMDQAIAVEGAPGSHFREFVGAMFFRLLAWLVWLAWILFRLIGSPFVAPERLPRAITVNDAERKLRLTKRKIEMRQQVENPQAE
jgi:hypothetical protein